MATFFTSTSGRTRVQSSCSSSASNRFIWLRGVPVRLGPEQRAVAFFQMPLQLRLVRQNAVQAAIQARIVDLAFFDLQQIVQRGGWIPALLDSQFAARRA